jgi:hypothetical protein
MILWPEMISVQSQHVKLISGLTPLVERMAMSVSPEPHGSDELAVGIESLELTKVCSRIRHLRAVDVQGFQAIDDASLKTRAKWREHVS